MSHTFTHETLNTKQHQTVFNESIAYGSTTLPTLDITRRLLAPRGNAATALPSSTTAFFAIPHRKHNGILISPEMVESPDDAQSRLGLQPSGPSRHIDRVPAPNGGGPFSQLWCPNQTVCYATNGYGEDVVNDDFMYYDRKPTFGLTYYSRAKRWANLRNITAEQTPWETALFRIRCPKPNICVGIDERRRLWVANNDAAYTFRKSTRFPNPKPPKDVTVELAVAVCTIDS
jgi:hypothetical protein